MFCQQCGRELAPGAQFCSYCGAPAGGAGPQGAYTNYRTLPAHKDTGVALILALVLGLFALMGIGQIYVGRTARGIAILLGGLLIEGLAVSLVFASFFGGPVAGLFTIAIVSLADLAYYLWQAYDAYDLVQQYNRAVDATGRVPW